MSLLCKKIKEKPWKKLIKLRDEVNENAGRTDWGVLWERHDLVYDGSEGGQEERSSMKAAAEVQSPGSAFTFHLVLDRREEASPCPACSLQFGPVHRRPAGHARCTTAFSRNHLHNGTVPNGLGSNILTAWADHETCVGCKDDTDGRPSIATLYVCNMLWFIVKESGWRDANGWVCINNFMRWTGMDLWGGGSCFLKTF